MEARLLIKAIGFIFTMVVGIPGNVFILLKFTFIKITLKKFISANTILMVLALSNLLVVFSRVIPQALHAIGVEDLLDDTKCKLVLFTYRVSRAMSICITSFLSCHQCVLVAPITRYWTYLKEKLSKNVSLIMILILGMNILLYPSTILYGKAKSNDTSPYSLHLVYCDADFSTYMSFLFNGLVSVIREIIFVGLMTLSSSYMVSILYQHGKIVKHIRSSDRDQRTSVEYRASRAVILLVTLYVILYGMDNSMWIYTLSLSTVSPEINDTRILLAASYAALSPVVIIATNPKLHRKTKNLWKKKINEVQKGGIKNISFVSSIS
ncbi:PREDICTED: vomeronasal type-1 receptor 4-like [Nanorana parkeri]|uniref:vomeronasal type-1 receptor 4-like n=1 Tax=Nanorana parkeri TaxID=125878 RepID=UPI000854A03F|nr:PREDICTED: vomeronasal type-1 receptor 4-like [Nanorana parkeri]